MGPRASHLCPRLARPLAGGPSVSVTEAPFPLTLPMMLWSLMGAKAHFPFARESFPSRDCPLVGQRCRPTVWLPVCVQQGQ